jgi:hypothetical protein
MRRKLEKNLDSYFALILIYIKIFKSINKLNTIVC